MTFHKPVRADTVYRKVKRAIFKVRSTVTFIKGVGATHLWEKSSIISINSASPNGLFESYFCKLFYQNTEGVSSPISAS
jgi:hypothetical protein